MISINSTGQVGYSVVFGLLGMWLCGSVEGLVNQSLKHLLFNIRCGS